jgi:tripartite-type tricarboxylate transporter receptor subunit TctC
MNSIDVRRRLLLAGAAATVGTAALAQGMGRPVRILVGFPAGQATDNVARLLAERLGAETGRNYIVENRPGQGGSLALGELARAQADGSVMMLAHMSALCTNPHLYKRVPYTSLKDFEPVGLVGDLPFVLVCHPSIPVRDVRQLIARAKAEPNQLTFASSGAGTVSHLAMEDFQRRAGISLLHVPYKGSVAGLTDVSSGSVSVALETASAVTPFVESGRVRPLAVAVGRRLGGVLDVPTMREQGMGDFNASTWLMLLYPRGVQKSAVKATFEGLRSSMRNPEVERKLDSAHCLPRYSDSPEAADAYLRSEYAKWGGIVKRSGVTLD